MTSTGLVCRKIERLCTSLPPDRTSINAMEEEISLEKCQPIQRDIEHLLQTLSSKSYLDSVETLLSSKNDTLVVDDNRLDSKNLVDDTQHATLDSQKLDGIRRAQKDCLRRVLDLEQEALDWRLKLRTLETQLQENVKTRYNNPQIQAAFVTCTLAKAESAEKSRRLESNEEYLSRVKQMTCASQKSYGSMDQIHKETVDAINNVSVQIKAINTVKSMNANGIPLILEQKQRNMDLMNDIGRLHDYLKNDMMDDTKLKSFLSSDVDGVKRLESVNTPVDIISNLLDPSSLSLSSGNILKNLESLLERHLLLSSIEQSTVSHELETLALAWGDELEENGIDLPDSDPDQDAVDTVIGSVNALKDHVDSDWDRFVKLHQDQLSAKLNYIDDNKKEISKSRQLLNERDMIIKGLIGGDYTAQERNLEEWFQLLDQMKA
ncbi:hypothetical protein BC941DRAFT_430696 [Chlamydoabsidia padenii]|nr:hypothetical protein BC941DRAFT_430696 [Chlamydoabsidia padenii]